GGRQAAPGGDNLGQPSPGLDVAHGDVDLPRDPIVSAFAVIAWRLGLRSGRTAICGLSSVVCRPSSVEAAGATLITDPVRPSRHTRNVFQTDGRGVLMALSVTKWRSWPLGASRRGPRQVGMSEMGILR